MLNIEKDLVEYDDHIEYKGKKIFKPFVEKPCNGDDHNIYIYYPPSLGGGHKRLFRKTKNLCSLYIPNEDNIRRDKSYIYEEFLQTDGFDIKVYTIGPEYAHAEARKSPSLDGVVKRSPEGKEVRYPVNLTPFEKELARKIVNIFKQNVCGFDILRSKGKSYVCDVNGWSFVKGNKKYYEDCAILIRKMILTYVEPEMYAKNPLALKIHVPTYEELILPHIPKHNNNHAEELRSVVAVFRHADRSPKQKMKLVVKDPRILSLFKKFGNKDKIKEIKLKKPKELMEVHLLATKILEENNIDEDTISGLNDNFLNKLMQLKMVLEKNMNFEGMTRKIQLKPLKITIEKDQEGKEQETVTEALFIFKWGGDITHAGIEQAKLLGNTFRVQIYPSGSTDDIHGDGLLRLHSTYRHDLKCYSSDEGRCMKTAAAFLQGLLQLDGSLIPIISSMVRKDDPVLDLLDVSSDEIAEIKAKVKEEVSECLNHDGNLLAKFKNYFKNQVIYHSSDEQEDHALFKLMEKINNPLKLMNNIYNLIEKLIKYIKTLLTQEELELDSGTYLIRRHSILQRRKSNHSSEENLLEPIKESRNNKGSMLSTSTMNDKKVEFDCEDEKIILIYKRWIKLYQDFFNFKKNIFDISKIPDIYDNIKYDLIHNQTLLNDDAYNLYYCINMLANFVMPLEYGITVEEKVKIGIKVIGTLLNKIHNDLLWWVYPNNNNTNYYGNVKDFEYENESYSGLDRGKLNNDIKSAWRHVKTRFYFTSASHLYSLINTIIFGIDSYLIDQTNQNFIKELKNVLDLDYCSHIIFRLYENFNFNFVKLFLLIFRMIQKGSVWKLL
jgi:inositol hexakisphosphate/diphosphoinositol-pentakisphosphate kinase